MLLPPLPTNNQRHTTASPNRLLPGPPLLMPYPPPSPSPCPCSTLQTRRSKSLYQVSRAPCPHHLNPQLVISIILPHPPDSKTCPLTGRSCPIDPKLNKKKKTKKKNQKHARECQKPPPLKDRTSWTTTTPTSTSFSIPCWTALVGCMSPWTRTTQVAGVSSAPANHPISNKIKCSSISTPMADSVARTCNWLTSRQVERE